MSKAPKRDKSKRTQTKSAEPISEAERIRRRRQRQLEASISVRPSRGPSAPEVRAMHATAAVAALEPARWQDHWRHIGSVTVAECVALSLGYEPGQPSLDHLAEYVDRLELAVRCLGQSPEISKEGAARTLIEISAFVEWAESVEWELAYLAQSATGVITPESDFGKGVPGRPMTAKEQRGKAILQALRQNGEDPLRLTPYENGKPSTKTVIRDQLGFTPSTFNKAWQYLHDTGQIAYSS